MVEVTVSEPVAQFFYQQCAGETNGHMASIPNNPVIYGLIQAHKAMSPDDFARFLRQVADCLTKEQPF